MQCLTFFDFHKIIYSILVSINVYTNQSAKRRKQYPMPPHSHTKKKHTQTYPFIYPFPAIFLSNKQKLNFKKKGSQSELNKITF